MQENQLYSKKEITSVVISNLIKMFSARKIHETSLSQIQSSYNYVDDELFIDNIFVKIFHNKISKLGKIIPYQKYIADENIHTIIIVKSINYKIFLEIMKYSNTEIFFIHELMINLIDKDFVPEHQLLSDEIEKEIFLKEYLCSQIDNYTNEEKIKYILKIVNKDLIIDKNKKNVWIEDQIKLINKFNSEEEKVNYISTLSTEIKDKIILKSKLETKDLPRILSSDPIVRY